jgi:hypothetical protein
MNSIRPNRAWVSVKEAAAHLSVSTSTILRLRQALDPFTRKPFLVSSQPSPHLILISTDSLEAHRKAAQDLEFGRAVNLREARPARSLGEAAAAGSGKGKGRGGCIDNDMRCPPSNSQSAFG